MSAYIFHIVKERKWLKEMGWHQISNYRWIHKRYALNEFSFAEAYLLEKQHLDNNCKEES